MQKKLIIVLIFLSQIGFSQVRPIIITGNNSICKGDQTSLTASGGLLDLFMWSPSTGINITFGKIAIANPIITTTYSVFPYSLAFGQGGGNNYDTASMLTITIFVAPTPLIDLPNDTFVCQGTVVILDAKNPGSNYHWNTGETTQIIQTDTSSVYEVMVSNNNCSAIGSLWVGFCNDSPFTIPIVDSVICKGESVAFFQPILINGACGWKGYIEEWTPSINRIYLDQFTSILDPSPTITTTYTIKYALGLCPDLFKERKLTITVKNPIFNIEPAATICLGESIQLKSSGEKNYFWYPSIGLSQTNIAKPIANPTISTTYTVNSNSDRGCEVVDNFKVIIEQGPVLSLPNDTFVCAGRNLFLDAENPGFTFQWNTGETTQAIHPDTSGIYRVSVSNNNCSSMASVNVGICSYDILPSWLPDTTI